ncbi:YggT family protein [Acaricomes phytoseiuli]|uniref:YggT family protein n=1 Tax=Acaricomes phytoseiuli TaxID=291968 RepID=UPI00037FE0C0|nr:YggT family protein [Acaricomes phytoseiuli]MCW1249558.1 YggT family protein [Acaricomes phytoseiuli]
MGLVFTFLNVLILLFYLSLLLRIIFDWVQQFARDWRPQGVALVAATGVYTVTDPPVRLVRRVIPPLQLGTVSLDVGLLVIFVLTWILLGVTGSYAA